MKLIKRENKQTGRGCFIDLIIGKTTYESYWSSPPTSIDHVGLEYLEGRYIAINTKVKMETFKELYKNLWIEVSKSQRGMMEHCVGLNYKNKPYRNYYCTIADCTEWNDIVSKGLATKGKPGENGMVHFWLTKQGVEFLLDKSISKKVYEEI